MSTWSYPKQIPNHTDGSWQKILLGYNGNPRLLRTPLQVNQVGHDHHHVELQSLPFWSSLGHLRVHKVQNQTLSKVHDQDLRNLHSKSMPLNHNNASSSAGGLQKVDVDYSSLHRNLPLAVDHPRNPKSTSRKRSLSRRPRCLFFPQAATATTRA